MGVEHELMPPSQIPGEVEGQPPPQGGEMSAPLAKEWLKMTLVHLGGLGVGLGLGEGARRLYNTTPFSQTVGKDPRWLHPAGAALGSTVAMTGWMVRQKQRELLERAKQEAAEQGNPRPGGPPSE